MFNFKRPERGNEFVTVAELRKGGLNLGQLYRTVSPALAFQYVSPKPPLEYSNNTDDSSSGRVPTYFNNLNSWLGQTMQRDCPQVLWASNRNCKWNVLDLFFQYYYWLLLVITFSSALDTSRNCWCWNDWVCFEIVSVWEPSIFWSYFDWRWFRCFHRSK